MGDITRIVPAEKIARVGNFVFAVSDPSIDHVTLDPDGHGPCTLIAVLDDINKSEYSLATVMDKGSIIIHGGHAIQFDITIVGADVTSWDIEAAVLDVLDDLESDEFGTILCPRCGGSVLANIDRALYSVRLYHDIEPRTNKPYEEVMYDHTRYGDSSSDIIYESVGCSCGWRAFSNVH